MAGWLGRVMVREGVSFFRAVGMSSILMADEKLLDIFKQRYLGMSYVGGLQDGYIHVSLASPSEHLSETDWNYHHLFGNRWPQIDNPN